MTFANPLGLLGLLAVPVILGIHLFHRRFPPLEVAGLHLWAAESEVRLAGRRRDRLPITATLLLELLAALLMTMVISQPRFGELDKVTHLVVVLDNSASMQGRPAGRADFRTQAISALEDRINGLQRHCAVTLILTGTRPVMLAGPAVEWDQAKARLSQWNPQATRHDFAPAWELARQVAAESGQLLFLTDYLPDEGSFPSEMEVLAVGSPLGNLAFTTAVWDYDAESATGQIALRLSNLSGQDVRARVIGRSQGTEVFEKSVEIPARGKSALATTVPGGLGRMEIEVISANDGLALDSRVELVEPKLRPVAVAVLLPDGRARELFQRSLSAVPNVALTGVEEADLIIADSSQLPEMGRDVWWLGVGPLDPGEPARKAAKAVVGPYVVERQNPLLEGVTLSGVVWAGVQPVPHQVTPLVTVGRTPLLSQLKGAPTVAYLANIDLEESNLGESPDWPILISNLIELRRGDLPGLNRWNYRLGEGVAFRLKPAENETQQGVEGRTLTLRLDGEEKSISGGTTVAIQPPAKCGFFEIHDENGLLDRFAVNFEDSEESNLRELSAGNRAPRQRQVSAQYQVDPKYSWILLAATMLVLVVLLANWWMLGRARPVRS